MGAYTQNDRAKAALLDVGGNVQVALITSVAGLAVVGPLPIAAYRGWVGGIVSVDAQHRSRLGQPGCPIEHRPSLPARLRQPRYSE